MNALNAEIVKIQIRNALTLLREEAAEADKWLKVGLDAGIAKLEAKLAAMGVN